MGHGGNADIAEGIGGRRGGGIAARLERLLEPFPAAEPAIPPDRLLPFVGAATRGARGLFAAMALATAVVAAFEALLFALLGRLVDSMQAVEPATWWARHGAQLGWLGLALALGVAVVAAQTMLKHQALAVNLPMRLRWTFHRLLLRQSMTFWQDEFAGRATTKVMQTALAVRDALFVVADVLVTMAVYIGTMIAASGAFDPRLTLPFVAWLALYVAQLAWFVPRLSRIGAAQADARSLMTGRVTDAYSNIATVQLFSHARREAEHAREAMREFTRPAHAQMRLVSAFEIVNHVLSTGLLVALAGTALWLWTRGEVGPGAVAAGGAMALRLTGMSHWIMWETTGLFESVGTLHDGIATLARPRSVVDAPDAARLDVVAGEIRFDDVTFRYPSTPAGAAPVVDRLTLRVAPGERIGLIGRSGAGKSTLVNLLLRLHEPQAGRITIDGQDVARVTQESLRAGIGMVTQDTSLLHRSVADNVGYGRPQASRAEIEAACERAQADGFIARLADARGRRGLDAHVGERGVKLSGGQRQRIAIARVMLKNAPILLLDEATSALDSEVEAAIQASLATLMRGKTVIAIAHRLSTIAALDRLVVMDAGRIVEEGDHASLLARGGLYAQLWRRQSGGFLGEDVGDGADAAVASA